MLVQDCSKISKAPQTSIKCHKQRSPFMEFINGNRVVYCCARPRITYGATPFRKSIKHCSACDPKESKTGGQGCMLLRRQLVGKQKFLQIRRVQLPAATLPRQDPAHIPGPAPSTSDLASLWRTPFHFVKLWTAWSKGKHAFSFESNGGFLKWEDSIKIQN